MTLFSRIGTMPLTQPQGGCGQPSAASMTAKGTGKILSFAVLALLLGAESAIAKPGNTFNVWQAWKDTVQMTKALPAYRLSGSNHAFAGAGNANPAETITWSSIVSGPKYKVGWSREGGGTGSASYSASFDGKLWYGLTSEETGQEGTVTDNPVKAYGVGADENLLKRSAGLFYPTAAQLFTMYENFGGQNLLDKYLSVSKLVKVTVSGSNVRLLLSRKDAQRYNLPDEMDFTLIGKELCPTKTVILPRKNSITIVCEAHQFANYGSDFQYPSEIERTFVSDKDGAKTTVFHSDTHLKIEPFNVASYSFALVFEPDVDVIKFIGGKVTSSRDDNDSLKQF